MPSYAVIQTGGKQYRVKSGDVIDVEKLDEEVGSRIDLTSVLLVGEDDGVSVGTPIVDGAKVTAEVAEQFRGPKIIVYKYKAKTRYRRKNGHRQSYTRLRIRHILTDGAEAPIEEAAPVAETVVEESSPAPQRRRRAAQPAAEAEEQAAEAATEEPVASAEDEAPTDGVEPEAASEETSDAAAETPAEESAEGEQKA